MYVENGGKSIKGLEQMQGRQTGGGGVGEVAPPQNFRRGGSMRVNPPDFERIFFLIAHICYYVQVISIFGGGGGLASSH